MNPEQYLLPREFMNYGAQQFSGAPRPQGKKQPRTNKQIIEMENAMVPTPRVFCFICDVCRKGPMIRCDSCSASFHFDCLNPPLTGIPQGRWRCHLHTEPVLEQKVLKTLSLTERVAIYDKSRQQLDPIQTALNFFTKSQQAKYYYFRNNAPYKGKHPVQIPKAIANCYNYEEDLEIFSDNDNGTVRWPQANKVAERIYKCDGGDCDEERNMDCTLRPNTEATSLQLLADVAFMDQMTAYEVVSSEQTNDFAALSTAGAIATTATSATLMSKESQIPTNMSAMREKRLGSQHVLLEQCLMELKSKNSDVSDSVRQGNNTGTPKDDELLEGLDITTIRTLAALKLRELRSDESIESSLSDTEGNQFPPLSQPCQPSSVFPTSTNNNSVTSSSRNPNSQYMVPLSVAPNVMLHNSKSNVGVHTDANLKVHDISKNKDEDSQVEVPSPYITLQVINSNVEVKFAGISLSIGRGEDNDMDLREHSPCTTPSDNHCVIFYDSVCAAWELLNYSPDGTFVNHCLYGCDRAKISSGAKSTAGMNSSNVVANPSSAISNNFNHGKTNPSATDIIDEAYDRLRVRRALEAQKERAQKKSNCCPCTKQINNYENISEGGARLYSGSRIQIGCVKIVITDIGVDRKVISVPEPLQRYNINQHDRIIGKNRSREKLMIHEHDIKVEISDVIQPVSPKSLDSSTSEDEDVGTRDSEEEEVVTSRVVHRKKTKLDIRSANNTNQENGDDEDERSNIVVSPPKKKFKRSSTNEHTRNSYKNINGNAIELVQPTRGGGGRRGGSRRGSRVVRGPAASRKRKRASSSNSASPKKIRTPKRVSTRGRRKSRNTILKQAIDDNSNTILQNSESAVENKFSGTTANNGTFTIPVASSIKTVIPMLADHDYDGRPNPRLLDQSPPSSPVNSPPEVKQEKEIMDEEEEHNVVAVVEGEEERSRSSIAEVEEEPETVAEEESVVQQHESSTHSQTPSSPPTIPFTPPSPSPPPTFPLTPPSPSPPLSPPTSLPITTENQSMS